MYVCVCMSVCMCVCVGIPPKKVHCYTLNILLFYITFFGAACCWFSSSSSSNGYIQANICTYDVCMYVWRVCRNIFALCCVFVFSIVVVVGYYYCILDTCKLWVLENCSQWFWFCTPLIFNWFGWWEIFTSFFFGEKWL